MPFPRKYVVVWTCRFLFQILLFKERDVSVPAFGYGMAAGFPAGTASLACTPHDGTHPDGGPLGVLSLPVTNCSIMAPVQRGMDRHDSGLFTANPQPVASHGKHMTTMDDIEATIAADKSMTLESQPSPASSTTSLMRSLAEGTLPSSRGKIMPDGYDVSALDDVEDALLNVSTPAAPNFDMFDTSNGSDYPSNNQDLSLSPHNFPDNSNGPAAEASTTSSNDNNGQSKQTFF